MTLPRVELSQLSLARRNFVDRFASDPWHARVIWQDIELTNVSQRAIRPLWVIHVIPAILARPVRPKSGHWANARVYEGTAYGTAENKSLEIKSLRPRRVPRC
jgi:hypothetical protein